MPRIVLKHSFHTGTGHVTWKDRRYAVPHPPDSKVHYFYPPSGALANDHHIIPHSATQTPKQFNIAHLKLITINLRFPTAADKSRSRSQRATKVHVTQQQQFLFMAPSIPLTFQDRAVTRHQISFPKQLSSDPEAREPLWALTKSCYTLLTDSESLTVFTPPTIRPQDRTSAYYTPCFGCINATLLWPRKLGSFSLVRRTLTSAIVFRDSTMTCATCLGTSLFELVTKPAML